MVESTVVITGANAGLGFETAVKLARTGARVVMACRNLEKAGAAQRELARAVPGARTLVLPLDVSEPASVRELGRRFADEVGQLDVLINNAGTLSAPTPCNSAGHELQLATNHLGPFALIATLLPFFRRDAQSRIVNVGSLAHRFARLDLDDLNWERQPHDELKRYARSKLCLLSFTMELDRRLRARGSHIIALAAHPGFAATEIGTNSPALAPKNAFGKWLQDVARLLIPSAAQAASPIVHAACADGVSGGDYYGPRGLFEIAGKPGKARVHSLAKDVDTGKRLWALSEAMTGVRWLSE